MSQTEVADSMTAEPIVGSVQEARSIATATSEEASAEIPFGVMVKHGTEDDGCLLPTDPSPTDLKGIVVHSHAYAKTDELGTTGLKPKVTMGVLRQGTIWVLPEEAVAPGDEVHVRVVAGIGEQKGAFRGSFDGTDTTDISQFAQWRTSGSSTQPALLEIDMANAALAASY